ncbi:hypothetical protein A2U01_0049554, partial [Trifolium medium]|nr:hypothetical protein [Trifolium medium]
FASLLCFSRSLPNVVASTAHKNDALDSKNNEFWKPVADLLFSIPNHERLG